MRGRARLLLLPALHPPNGTAGRMYDVGRGGARFLMPARAAAAFTTCPIAFGVSRSPQSLPMRLTRRKMMPALIPAATVHASRARLTHAGTGTVRICFPLPIKSAMTQCSSRIWKSSTLRPTSSARRKPHPTRIATIARSRFLPKIVSQRNAVVKPWFRRRSASSRSSRPTASRLSPGGCRPPDRG